MASKCRCGHRRQGSTWESTNGSRAPITRAGRCKRGAKSWFGPISGSWRSLKAWPPNNPGSEAIPFSRPPNRAACPLAGPGRQLASVCERRTNLSMPGAAEGDGCHLRRASIREVGFPTPHDPPVKLPNAFSTAKLAMGVGLAERFESACLESRQYLSGKLSIRSATGGPGRHR